MNPENLEKEILDNILKSLDREELISVHELRDLLRRAIKEINSTNEYIRPYDLNGEPGGIIRLRRDLPTIIIPDIHGRTGLLKVLLQFQYNEQTVWDSLSKGEMQLLFLGDAFHTEWHCQTHWVNAYLEYENNYIRHKAMDEEMIKNFNVLQSIIMLILLYPDRVYFLKGNHENILNENKDGNFPFGKYVHEGEMVKNWMSRFYGIDTVALLAEYEKCLPVFAVGKNFLASHSEPLEKYTEDQIINYRIQPQVIYGLTWTSNDKAQQGSVRKLIEIFIKENPKDAVYFGGHRIINGKYCLRNGNKFIQIHNPAVYQIAFVFPERKFDPDKDIIQMGSE